MTQYHLILLCVPFRLKADYSVDCTTSLHTQYQLLGLVAVVLFPLGIPLLFYLLVRRSRAAIQDKEHEDHKATLKRYAFLLDDFKHEYYYWEPLDLCRKLILTSLHVAPPPCLHVSCSPMHDSIPVTGCA